MDANRVTVPMRTAKIHSFLTFLLVFFWFLETHVYATPKDAMSSVVSVLPEWPGHAKSGTDPSPGRVPEGSGVVVGSGLIATAWHVVKQARRIDVRIWDGRVIPARLIAHDAATDIAILSADIDLKPVVTASEPNLAQPVCAIGNAYGLGASVTCGVVSAVRVTNAGFNAVEDFIQTDAAVNPGMSGGALVDKQGRMVGLVSAIFASNSDSNIGVNFAVSASLLLRVVDALSGRGEVRYPKPGWKLASPNRVQLTKVAAPVVREVDKSGRAAAANIRPGDLIVEIAQRRVMTPKDVVTALAVLSEETTAVEVKLMRDRTALTVSLQLSENTAQNIGEQSNELHSDCSYPPQICILRQAVFPISSFDPMASATRIASNLLVTNRHVLADRKNATIQTPNGLREALIVPSAYKGDLVLLEVSDLPKGGHIPVLENIFQVTDPLYTIGADLTRQEIRVFEPGDLISGPSRGSELGRLHVRAQMQAGVSGGALVDSRGALVGIAVGGGEGLFEAIPASQVRLLLELRSSDTASHVTRQLGKAFAECEKSIQATKPGIGDQGQSRNLVGTCSFANNQGQLLAAGRGLARTGDYDGARTLLRLAVEQVPNSINARKSLLVALQMAARFEEMIIHARWLLARDQGDPMSIRFAIQSGVWGNQPELAEQGYRALLKADPRQALAARRFIDQAPPAPPRR